MEEQKTGLAALARAFLKLGAMSYGGPAIMGIMQAELQEKRGWISKEKFLEGLALVNMLPGPGATQLGIYVGYERAGWRGGLVAGLCFILPAFLIMVALTLAYAAYGALPAARGAFYGLGPVVLGIFAVALYRLGRNALKNQAQVLLALAAAAVAAFTPLGIGAILLLAGCIGIALHHSKRQGLAATAMIFALLAALHAAGPQLASIDSASSNSTAAPGLWDVGSFFFKVGALTFGGGLTMLAFVQEQVVNQLRWLTPREYLDGLALGQLTPGPILMLAAYVGYKVQGLAGAAIGALAVFLPSFILMLSVMPLLARLRHLLWIKAAMRGIGAAAIGAIGFSLLQMAPAAVPDAVTLGLLVLTIIAILAWRAGPLPLMLGGAFIGASSRLNPLQRLKELEL
jgi:chromate transporter